MLFELDANQELELLMVNNGFYKMTGLKPMSMNRLSEQLETATPDLDFMAHLRAATQTKQVIETQTTHPTPNGDVTAQIKILPVLTTLGEVSHIVLLAHDITSEVAKDEIIHNLRQKLKAKTKT